MAPAYTITYFDSIGAAEAIRMLFSYGGIEFEDKRLPREEWPALKPSTPYGQLPILTHNGKTISQSIAIARYVAKEVKLTGNNNWEDLEIDSMVDAFGDLKQKLVAVYYEQNEELKKEKQKIAEEAIKFYLTKFDDASAKNNGYLCVGRLTWADIVLVSWSSYIKEFDEYSNLKALKERVLAIPNIKKWVEKRPPQ